MINKLMDSYYTKQIMDDVKFKFNEMLSGSGSFPIYANGSGAFDWNYDIETYFDQKNYTQTYKLKKNDNWTTPLDNPTKVKAKVPDRTIRPARKIIVEDSEAI